MGLLSSLASKVKALTSSGYQTLTSTIKNDYNNIINSTPIKTAEGNFSNLVNTVKNVVATTPQVANKVVTPVANTSSNIIKAVNTAVTPVVQKISPPVNNIIPGTVKTSTPAMITPAAPKNQMVFPVGDGISNVTTVNPGPLISTEQAYQRGDIIKPVEQGQNTVISPLAKAKETIATPESVMPITLYNLPEKTTQAASVLGKGAINTVAKIPSAIGDAVNNKIQEDLKKTPLQREIDNVTLAPKLIGGMVHLAAMIPGWASRELVSGTFTVAGMPNAELQTASDPVLKYFMGEEPVKAFGARISGTNKILTTMGASSDTASFLAPVLVGLTTLIDVTGLTPGKSTALNLIKKQMEKSLAEKLGEDAAKSLSEGIAEEASRIYKLPAESRNVEIQKTLNDFVQKASEKLPVGGGIDSTKSALTPHETQIEDLKKFVAENKAETPVVGSEVNVAPKIESPALAAQSLEDVKVAETLRQSKGLSVADIIAKNPDINLKRDVPITDIYGVKKVIPEGEALTPYEMKGNKVVLQDGETYIVSKNQYANIKGQSIKAEAKEFAPELKGTEEKSLGVISADKIKELSAQRAPLEKKLKELKTTELDKYNKWWDDFYKNRYTPLAEKDGTMSVNKALAQFPEDKIQWDKREAIFPQIKEIEKQLEDIAWDMGSGSKGATKYSNYQLPGGENYKEILIKAPTTAGNTPELIAKYRSEFPQMSESEIQKSINSGDLELPAVASFRSSHWDEPNVIAHLRLNERTIDGKKVTFMEELQSDWAREARKKGTITPSKIAEAEKAKKELSILKKKMAEPISMDELENYFTPGKTVKGYSGNDKVIAFHKRDGFRDWTVDVAQVNKDGSLAYTRNHATMPDVNNVRADLKNKISDFEKVVDEVRYGVNDNPLLKNWQELSIKRALKEAVDNGSDYLAWTTGEQQAARYNLSTQVEKIEWSETTKGNIKVKDVSIKTKGRDFNELSYPRIFVDKNGKIVDTLYADNSWKGKNINDVIGKGVGEKIMSKAEGNLSGEGLNIGAEWAKNLYDRQVKNIVEDLTGQKVKVLDMGLPVDNKTTTWYTTEKSGDYRGGSVTKGTLTSKNIKVGELVKNSDGDYYVITDVLGDGKFKAVPKKVWDFTEGLRNKDVWGGADKEFVDRQIKAQIRVAEQTFDISTKKSAGQQAIKITPEIKAMIEGKAPELKKPSGKLPEFANLKKVLKSGAPIEEKFATVKKVLKEKADMENEIYSNWDSELQSQYTSFKKIVKENFNPKTREKLLGGDDETFKKALADSGISKEKIDNIFYSQDKNSSEIFDMFKNRWNKVDVPSGYTTADLVDHYKGLSELVNESATKKEKEINVDEIMKEIKGEKTVGSVVKSRTIGPGHDKFNASLDKMVANNTLHPEDADILKTVFSDTNDSWLKEINMEENTGIQRSGMAYYASKRATIKKGIANLKDKEFWSRPDIEPSVVLLHEYGHLAHKFVLTGEERGIVKGVFDDLKRSGRLKLFEEGLSKKVTVKGHDSAYFAKNELEFLAQSFAEYVIENKVPAEKMKPLLQRLAQKFFDGLKKLVNRNKPEEMKMLEPIFEKMISGEKVAPLSDFLDREPVSYRDKIKNLLKTLEEEKQSKELKTTSEQGVKNIPKAQEASDKVKTPAVEEIKYPVNPEKGVTIHAYIKDGSVKLESIDISPSKQKQGLGTKYVKDLEKWGKENGATKIEIGSNKESVDFWKKQGFKMDENFGEGILSDYKYGSKEIIPKEVPKLENIVKAVGEKKATVKEGAKIAQENIDNLKNITEAVKGSKLTSKENATIVNDGVESFKKTAEVIKKKLPKKTMKELYDTANKQKTDRENAILVNKLIKALKPLRRIQEKIYTEERGAKMGKSLGMGKNLTGEKWANARVKALSGAMTKVEPDIESLRKVFPEKDVDGLFNMIKDSERIGEWSKITAINGFRKLIDGKLPTNGELNTLSKVFGNDLVKELQSKRTLFEKILEGGYQLLNIPRSLMSSYDLSAPLRQGIFMVGRPKKFGSAMLQMFKDFGSEKAYKEFQASIVKNPYYDLMERNWNGEKLSLTDLGSDLTGREEAFMSQWAEKIPGIGIGVKASSRAYSGFLNKLRVDEFTSLIKTAKDEGLLKYTLDNGVKIYDKESKKFLSDAVHFINTATGRGKFRGILGGAAGKEGEQHVIESGAKLLNTFFFSPRLMISRINLLNPAFYLTLHPIVRREALRSLFTFTGTTLSVLTLMKQAGVDIETDPRSSDFLKIKVGNTRMDIMGGFSQYIVAAARLISGKTISSQTGEEFTLGEGYKPLTRADIGLRFIASKENPVMSFVTEMFTGQTSLGQKVKVGPEILNRLIPMTIQDIYDIQKDSGWAKTPLIIPGLFGVGEQTYGKNYPVINPDTGKVELQGLTGIGEDIWNKITGNKSTTIPQSEWQDYINLYNANQEETSQSKQTTDNLTLEYNKVKNLSSDADKAKYILKLAETDKTFAKKVYDKWQTDKLGLTPKDSLVVNLGVDNMGRAKKIVEMLNQLSTPQEKVALIDDYINKKIITEDVGKQITQLLQQK